MLLDTSERDTLTLCFLIPNVSHLLIFRDYQNDSNVMRKVITELLRFGYYTKLYLGSNPESYLNSYTFTSKDSAVIRIKITGIALLEYKIDDYTDYFIAELQNRKNVIHFENVGLNREKQISGINISIKVTESVKVKSEIQAA